MIDAEFSGTSSRFISPDFHVRWGKMQKESELFIIELTGEEENNEQIIIKEFLKEN